MKTQRRSLAEMELWEQRLKNICKRWEGWSIRDNKGRVLVGYRPKQGKSEQVLLPKELLWSEACEDDITNLVKQLYKDWNNGALGLKAALKESNQKSDKDGESHSSSWQDIKEEYRKQLMESGSKIQQHTWEDNYERFIDAAIEVLKKQRPSDGPSLLRLTARQWSDSYYSRAVCISTLKGFTEFAVLDSRFKAPRSWLIDEFHAKPIRGQAPEKIESAALSDAEILKVLDAVEKRWGVGWRNCISVLVALGIRPYELSKLEIRKNADGEPQMWSTYRKSGGKTKTKPRWLEEIPLTADDGTKVYFNIAANWKTMEWPKTRTGERRLITAHYCEQYLKKVDYWIQLRAEYLKDELKVVPYSLRNSWNTRAKALGLPDGVVSRAFGNTEATNLRSYRQTTDALTRSAFKERLGR